MLQLALLDRLHLLDEGIPVTKECANAGLQGLLQPAPCQAGLLPALQMVSRGQAVLLAGRCPVTEGRQAAVPATGSASHPPAHQPHVLLAMCH